MAQIQKGDTFADGELVTAARLNALLDSAILNTNAITDQGLITTGSVNDTLLVYQASSATLKKITFDDLIGINTSGGLGVLTVTQIFGNTGLSIATGTGNVNVAGYNDTNIGNASSASGNTSIYSYNDINIDCSVGKVVVACTTNFTTTGAIKIPVGTTAQRPATLATGQLRHNTTTGFSEVYNGTAWANLTNEQPKIYVKSGVASGATGGGFVENIVYQTPTITSIPADETWTYQFWVETTSGEVNGNTRPSYGHVLLKVYNNTTLIATINGSTSAYGGHTATFTSSKSFTSSDPTPKLILKTSNYSGLSTEPNYLVTLTKVKTSTLSDATSCI